MSHNGNNPLASIDPDEIVSAYDALGLEAWSDFDLFRAAAEVISEPSKKFSSFLLNAPLELLARFCLLSLVAPEDRRLARIQMVATAVVYAHAGPGVNCPPPDETNLGSPVDTIEELRAAIHASDVERSDQLFTILATYVEPRRVIESIAHASLQTLTGAAHTHLGLMYLSRMPAIAPPEALKMARSGVRFLAAKPDLNLKPTNGPGRLDDLAHALATVPHLSKPASSVQEIIQATEDAGTLDDVLGSGVTRSLNDWQELTRTSCRIAALSMIADSVDAAMYGWTHCLTLPQAAWALGRVLTTKAFQAQVVQSAVTWVAAFRAAHGNGALNTHVDLQPSDLDISEALYDSPEAAAAVAYHTAPSARQQLVGIIATEAAVRTEAHLIKFTRACLDLARMDPEEARLYHAAAAYLCALWCDKEARSNIESALATRPGS